MWGVRKDLIHLIDQTKSLSLGGAQPLTQVERIEKLLILEQEVLINGADGRYLGLTF